jgi:hypothetical protein
MPWEFKPTRDENLTLPNDFSIISATRLSNGIIQIELSRPLPHKFSGKLLLAVAGREGTGFHLAKDLPGHKNDDDRITGVDCYQANWEDFLRAVTEPAQGDRMISEFRAMIRTSDNAAH